MLAVGKASVVLIITLLHAGFASEQCVEDVGHHGGHHGVQGLLN